MEALFHRRDYGYEYLTELTLDGLLTRLTDTTWVRKGAVLGPEDRIRALHTEIPPRLVLSHGAAWWVHSGLGRAPFPLTFITCPRRRFTSSAQVTVYELSLGPEDRTIMAGLPITTPERTLYDLLLPHVKEPGRSSEAVVKDIVGELSEWSRQRFVWYLQSMSRRPYVVQLRELFTRITLVMGV